MKTITIILCAVAVIVSLLAIGYNIWRNREFEKWLKEREQAEREVGKMLKRHGLSQSEQDMYDAIEQLITDKDLVISDEELEKIDEILSNSTLAYGGLDYDYRRKTRV